MKLNIAIAIYAVSGILAFGHCSANSELDTDRAAAAGIIAAIGSPFYWSWVIQDKFK